jgi:hypothetical protein
MVNRRTEPKLTPQSAYIGRTPGLSIGVEHVSVAANQWNPAIDIRTSFTRLECFSAPAIPDLNNASFNDILSWCLRQTRGGVQLVLADIPTAQRNSGITILA